MRLSISSWFLTKGGTYCVRLWRSGDFRLRAPAYGSSALFFLGLKCFSPLKFRAVCDYYSSKLRGKQYKQNTSPKSYKTKIKILANPGLA